MNYRVRWLRNALDQLADIWNRASDRNAVTAAADWAERTLGLDPNSCGESRSRGRRVLFVGPLAIFYRVNRRDQEVVITTVRPSRRRP
jgi:plasmid stabilization system protein ParE